MNVSMFLSYWSQLDNRKEMNIVTTSLQKVNSFHNNAVVIAPLRIRQNKSGEKHDGKLGLKIYLYSSLLL